MTNTNTMTEAQIAAKIEALAEQHKVWNEGTYKASKKELYQLLSDCLDFYNVVSASVQQRKDLYKTLSERGIKFNKSSSLATRIVRAVFGDCGKRAFSYARVITIAYDTKPENMTMNAFITNAGGIEQMRRKINGQTPSQRREENTNFAESLFAKRNPIIDTKLPSARALQPSIEATNQFSLALVRRNSDGTSNIVYGTNNVTLVDAVLADAGKAERAEEQKRLKLELESVRKNDNTNAVIEICEAG